MRALQVHSETEEKATTDGEVTGGGRTDRQGRDVCAKEWKLKKTQGIQKIIHLQYTKHILS